MKKINILAKKELSEKIDFDKDFEKIAILNKWNELFTDERWIIMEPAEEVVYFYEKYLNNPSEMLKERLSSFYNLIPDLGCGGDMHIYYFLEKGFKVTGADLSDNSINFTKRKLKEKKIETNLLICPMTQLPHENNYFNVTLSRATITHATLQDMKKSVYEIYRTTRKSGLLFISLISDRSSEWHKRKEIVPNLSYLPIRRSEKGLIFTFLNTYQSIELLEPFFRIEELFLAEHKPMIKDGKDLPTNNTYFGYEYITTGIKR